MRFEVSCGWIKKISTKSTKFARSNTKEKLKKQLYLSQLIFFLRVPSWPFVLFVDIIFVLLVGEFEMEVFYFLV
jgi:hypothetical protein